MSRPETILVPDDMPAKMAEQILKHAAQRERAKGQRQDMVSGYLIRLPDTPTQDVTIRFQRWEWRKDVIDDQKHIVRLRMSLVDYKPPAYGDPPPLGWSNRISYVVQQEALDHAHQDENIDKMLDGCEDRMFDQAAVTIRGVGFPIKPRNRTASRSVDIDGKPR